MAKYRKISLPVFLFTAFSLVMPGNAIAQSNAGTWERTFGGPRQDSANMVLPVPSGGFIVAGGTQSGGAGNSDAWIFTLDRNGRLGWSQKFGARKMELLTNVAPTLDGGFVFSDVTESFGRGKADAMFIRLSARGKVIWAISRGGSGWDYGASIFPSPTGGFIAAGRASSKGAGKDDAWILHMDDKGKIR